MSQFTKQYQDFFRDSEAGQQVLKDLELLINANHLKAEDDPDHSRDHMQRAKGNREALNKINSLLVEVKKPT